MTVLGIETSCDETAASVVKDGYILLSNVVATSIDLHVVFGGVVPEIAARSHIESIIPVIDKALNQAFPENRQKKNEKVKKHSPSPPTNYPSPSTKHSPTTNYQLPTPNYQLPTTNHSPTTNYQPPTTKFDPWDNIDAIAVTFGAGLGGSLLVGVMSARALAITKNKPLYAINHVEAHVYANFITESKLPSYKLPASPPEFPMLAIIVSGGHSQLVLFRNHFDYTLLGQTQDDAIGEAFDKVAKITGLPYPGGPSISKSAENGNPSKYQLPKAKLTGVNDDLEKLRQKMKKEKVTKHETQNTKLAPNYDFSFSGLKTAVLRLAQKEIGEDYTYPSYKISDRLTETQVNDISASFQRIAVESIVDKAILASEEFQPKSIVIAGGVAANQELRKQLTERLSVNKHNLKIAPPTLQYPDIKLCTDNGAMIATLGCFKAMNNQPTADPNSLGFEPNLSM